MESKVGSGDRVGVYHANAEGSGTDGIINLYVNGIEFTLGVEQARKLSQRLAAECDEMEARTSFDDDDDE